ncbi:MAG: histidine kinase, partial [Phaeodactylibacter sp.]|nr:histidine kinase [Phaeodactylibacter sp.]
RSLANDRFEPVIWIGQPSKLLHYNFDTKELHPVLEHGNLMKSHILDIVQAEDSAIWVGTPTQGIKAIKNGEVVLHLTQAEGLSSNNCKALFVDQSSRLWVGTDKGIDRIDLASLEITKITEAHGLLQENVTDLYVDATDLWVGTIDGLFKIPTASIQPSNSPPPVYLSTVKIMERDTIVAGRYTLRHSQNSLYFQFHSPHFKDRKNGHFKFRLIGLDSNWITTPLTENYARFTGVPPGETYQFEVVATNADGLASKEPLRVEVQILQPFWQKGWFQIMVVNSLLAILAFFILRNRRRRRLAQEKEKQQAQRILALRGYALRSQMNPHFIYNTLNAILYFLTQNERESATIYLSKFSRLIRYIFDHSNYNLIPVSEEIEFLKTYLALEKLRFREKVSIDFDYPSDLLSSDWQVPPLLIQPLIENSFKHGLFHKKSTGHLNIRFEADTN